MNGIPIRSCELLEGARSRSVCTGGNSINAAATTAGQAAADEESAPAPPGAGEVTASPGEEVSELRREIQSRKQTVEDLQAAVDMERAKLEEDPDYDQSFLLEVQDEQEQLRSAIETDEARLEELTRPGG